VHRDPPRKGAARTALWRKWRDAGMSCRKVTVETIEKSETALLEEIFKAEE
jgi:hypothetical protein